MPFAIGMTSARMSSSSGTPGRPANNTSTISSKLNSQNGSFRLRGLSTSARSPKQRPYSLWTSSRKMRRFGRDLRISFNSSETPVDLPTPVDACAGDIIVGARQVLAGRVGDHGDDGGGAAADADKTADGRPDLRDGHPACRQKSDPGKGSAHRNHTSESCHGS